MGRRTRLHSVREEELYSIRTRIRIGIRLAAEGFVAQGGHEGLMLECLYGHGPMLLPGKSCKGKGMCRTTDEVRTNGRYHLPDEASQTGVALADDDPAQMRYLGSGRMVGEEFWSNVSSSADQNARPSFTHPIQIQSWPAANAHG